MSSCVLSDHGQSQGATFRQRYGQSLEELIRDLMADRDVTVTAETGLEETAGPANTFLSQVSRSRGRPGTRCTAPSTAGRWTTRCTWSVDRRARVRAARRAGRAAPSSSTAGDVVVIASGNLSMVYFTAFPGRLTWSRWTRLYPGVVDALVAHRASGS